MIGLVSVSQWPRRFIFFRGITAHFRAEVGRVNNSIGEDYHSYRDVIVE